MHRNVTALVLVWTSVSSAAGQDLLGKRPEVRGTGLWAGERPVYLAGVWVGNSVSMDPRLHKPAIDGDQVAYSQLLSEATAPRLGIDSAHPPMSPMRVMQATGLLPEPSDRERRRWDTLQSFVRGLGDVPVTVDCAGTKGFGTRHFPTEWRHVGPGWHGFVPLCPERPETWKLYLDYWRDCAQQIVDAGANAFCYELFNEPAYNCRCDYNKRTFAERMRERYGAAGRANEQWGTRFDTFDAVATMSDMTETPGLWCDWVKFIGDRYVEILTAGRDAIREVDQRRPLYVLDQPAIAHTYLRCNGIDPVKVGRLMNIVGMEGGVSFGAMQPKRATDPMADVLTAKGLFSHQLYLDMARAFGKPVINTETYCGRFYNNVRFPSRRTDILTELWEEMIHGAVGSYFYNWGRRWWEWRDLAGAKRAAREVGYKAFSMLNPYAYPQEALQGFLDFQRDMDRVGADLLAGPRIRGRVALLVSQPTIRQLYREQSYTDESPYGTAMRAWYAALALEQIPADILWEEQAPAADLSKYRAILAPMAQYVYTTTVPVLCGFTEAGGRVIATSDAFQYDEYGRSIDASSLRVERLDEGNLRTWLAGNLDYRAIKLTSADGQGTALQCEAHRIRRPGKDYVYIVNWDTLPRLVRLQVQSPAGTVVTAPLDDAAYVPTAAGTLIHLPSQVRTLVRLSGDDLMAHRWTEADVRAAYEADLQRERAHLAEVEAELDAARDAAAQRQVVFDGPTNAGGEYVPDDGAVVLMHFNGQMAPEPARRSGPVTFTPGKLGAQGLHVDTNGTLLFRMPATFDPDRGSIELWARPDWPTADGKRHTMVDLKGPGAWNQNRFVLYKNKNYEIAFAVYDHHQKSAVARVPINIFRQRQWTHVCATWDAASGLRFYVNGEMKRETKALFDVERIDSFYVGSSGGTRYWNGTLDELRISNCERTYRAARPGDH